MKAPLFFIVAYISYASVAMDNSPANELEELFKRQGIESFVPRLMAHITKEKQRLEASIKNPDRICERQLSGGDWISFRNYDIALTANSPYVIPFEKWQLINCRVQVKDVTRQRLLLTVIPYCFPVLREADLPDATWKAVVWLEPEKGHLQPEEIKKNKQTIKQLAVCQINLENEYGALLKNHRQ